MIYTVRQANNAPLLRGLWNEPAWQQANTLEIDNFRPESGTHRPRTQAKMLFDEQGLHGIFQVQDQYVRCVHTEFQASVCQDSCVEFFVKPRPDSGYFNFEFNCGGTLLASYITDPERTPGGFKEFTMLTPEDGRLVQIYHSLPRVVETTLQEETLWQLQFFIPFALLAKYAGELGSVTGQEWTANFYKCGGDASYPHWASWSPVDQLNFHLPRCFAKLAFEN
jgi:hypothetical protein